MLDQYNVITSIGEAKGIYKHLPKIENALPLQLALEPAMN